MIRRPRTIALIGFFTLLFIVDWSLYFRHATHFFQADTIFLLNHRASSVSGYLKEFVALNPSGWYRPLANELIESILFPVAGLNPIPYRIPVYVVFFAITVGVYALTLALTRRHVAAAIAAGFFTVHTSNAYTTYDVGFMPELLYTFFFLGATLAYLRYVQDENKKRAYILSMVCLAGSLFSKEAAVMLPAALFATGFLFGPSSRSLRDRLIWTARSVTPHVLVCVAYFAFAVGYLNVMDLSPSKLLNQSRVPAPGDYIPVFNRGVLKNADLAVSWAFNIPRGWWGQWQRPNPGMVGYLSFFRIVVLVLGVAALLRPGRAVVALGFLWFWITIFPALPLVAHFLPYYLFLPVVGLSLIVGTAFVGLFDMLSRIHTSVAAAAITLLLGGVLYVTSRTIRNDIADNHLLGGSAKLALSTMNDLRRFYPELPPDATLYFADGQESVAWEHDSGGLVKMSYGLDTISARYQSQGEPLPFGDQKALVFKVLGGRLLDETAKYRNDPFKFIKVISSDLKLELSASDVTVGDQYTLRIKSVSNVLARFAYTVDDGQLEAFNALLDGDGKVVFNVSQQTRKGLYRFEAFSVSATDDWIRTGEMLRVR